MPVTFAPGRIELRRGASIFFLPQRSYVPTGTLRRAANYPDAAESRSREEIEEAFHHVGLDHLLDRLDEEAPWDHMLSGGESSASPSPAFFSTTPTSSCSTRRPPHSIGKAKIG
jgi:ABC-type uncharacterized transport system fused permease/ATPase subunit